MDVSEYLDPKSPNERAATEDDFLFLKDLVTTGSGS